MSQKSRKRVNAAMRERAKVDPAYKVGPVPKYHPVPYGGPGEDLLAEYQRQVELARQTTYYPPGTLLNFPGGTPVILVTTPSNDASVNLLTGAQNGSDKEGSD